MPPSVFDKPTAQSVARHTNFATLKNHNFPSKYSNRSVWRFLDSQEKLVDHRQVNNSDHQENRPKQAQKCTAHWLSQKKKKPIPCHNKKYNSQPPHKNVNTLQKKTPVSFFLVRSAKLDVFTFVQSFTVYSTLYSVMCGIQIMEFIYKLLY